MKRTTPSLIPLEFYFSGKLNGRDNNLLDGSSVFVDFVLTIHFDDNNKDDQVIECE